MSGRRHVYTGVPDVQGPGGIVAASAVAWTLFAAVVGAGFASGRELVLFLGRCAGAGPLTAVGVGVLIGLMAAPPGAARRPSPSPVVLRLTSVMLAWTTLAATLAALAHLAAPAASTHGRSLVAAALAAWAGAALPASRGLAPISRKVGPVIAAVVLAEALAWGAASALDLLDATAARAALGPPQWRPCMSGALVYAAGNALFGRAAVERLAGELRLQATATRRACALGGLMVGLVAGAGLWTVDLARSDAHPMPLTAAAARLHPSAGLLHMALLAGAAYTTAVAAASALVTPLRGLGRRMVSGDRQAGPVAAGLAIASVLPIARQGFVEAVHLLYPLAGWTALLALALDWIFAMTTRRRLY